jgi:DNA-binding MurR/RpiR family transcriptional regulator
VTATERPTLRERVAARADSLTATELRVARYFAEHPQEVAFASAEELGRATQTSDASVVRTAKALGFDGLPGLKRLLQAHLETLLTPANRLHNSLDAITDGPEGVLAATLAERIDLLTQAQRTVRADAFAEAVTLLAGARETLVCGMAGLSGVAEYFALRLTRIGRRARTGSDTGFRLADSLLPLGPDDIVIAIAHNRLMHEIDVALEHANRVGAGVILLTDSLGEMLRDRVSVVLSAPIGRPAMFSGQATTLAVLEALVLAVADVDRERSLAAITEMNRLREELTGPPIDGRAPTARARTTNGRAKPSGSRRRRTGS